MRTAYDALGLQTYFTSGPTETRAWTIRKGMTAPQVLRDHITLAFVCTDYPSPYLYLNFILYMVHISFYALYVQAAGVIHTDFEKGFIRAETITYQDMITAGSEKAVKEAGLMRSEGKEYVMREGDIVLFRFN